MKKSLRSCSSQKSDSALVHVPVLLEEVLKYLLTGPKGMYLDASCGGGGHSEAILLKLAPKGRLICCDRDEQALEYCKKRLKKFKGKVIFARINFKNIGSYLKDLKTDRVSGFLFDLGMSSIQLDDPERGFSYSKDGPLDMRMDLSQKKKAFDVVNFYPLEKLIQIFQKYGEEKRAKLIAKAIVEKRERDKIKTTKQLRDLVQSKVNPRHKIKSLSKIFQAVRIEVNDELDELKEGLNQAIEFLRPGGRLCVISYHSLEDRLVKSTFKLYSKGCICPPTFPECVCGGEKLLKILTKKPVVPDKFEKEKNPRAKSAKLRACEKSVSIKRLANEKIS